MLKIAICDDNKFICSEIENIILKHSKENKVKIEIEPFYKGEKLIAAIQSGLNFDLIFLDIDLISTTGIEIGKKIRNEFDDHISKIVFISARTGYEKKLFDVQPLNFLEKPLSTDKVINCLSLALKLTEMENNIFEFNVGHDIYRIKTDEIIYFEKQGKKINLVTIKSQYSFYGFLSQIADELPKNFIAPHSGYIINYNQIFQIKSQEIIMNNTDKIPISQRNLSIIRKYLFEREMEK